jgi:vacuolar-type H+-ATPase subunit I/STV1
MSNAMRAGFLYFIIVFGIGFLLGTIRVLTLIPRLGELISTLVELPIILSAAWIVCGLLVVRLRVPPQWQSRLTMGVLAFALLMMAESGLAVWLFGRTIPEHLESYWLLPQAIGLAGQVIFALFPLLQMGSNITTMHD